jgi:hypothetical protein
MWKEVGVTFEVLFRHIHGRNEKNYKSLGSTGQYLKVGFPKKK